MKEKIDKFIEYFTEITKEECDKIETILRWDDETKAAFLFAKSIFEEEMDHIGPESTKADVQKKYFNIDKKNTEIPEVPDASKNWIDWKIYDDLKFLDEKDGQSRAHEYWVKCWNARF